MVICPSVQLLSIWLLASYVVLLIFLFILTILNVDLFFYYFPQNAPECSDYILKTQKKITGGETPRPPYRGLVSDMSLFQSFSKLQNKNPVLDKVGDYYVKQT